MSNPKERLQLAAHAVETAARLLQMEEATMRAFLKECRDMENFGHIVDPTLYNKPERRAVTAFMQPLFAAALCFLDTHQTQIAKAKAALEAVRS